MGPIMLEVDPPAPEPLTASDPADGATSGDSEGADAADRARVEAFR